MVTWRRRLRLSPDAHEAMLRITGWGGALLTVASPFLIFGLARYSFFSLSAPGPLVRIVCVGFVGWATLVTLVVLDGSWVGVSPDWSRSAVLVAQAHLPLVAGAIAVYGLSFALQAFTASRFVAVATGGLWFPASLVGAYGAALGRAWSGAAVAGLIGFGVWLMIVGRPVLTLVGHLL